MKFSLIAAVVVLALAQGSFAQDATDIEKLGQYFEDMRNKITLELTEMIKNQDLANQAQTYINEKREELGPVATKVQEQLKAVATNVEEQLKPLTDNVQAQVQPMLDDFQKQMETIFAKMMDQARAIGN